MIAANCPPRSRKYAVCERVSSVVPDFEAERKSVRSGSIFDSSARIAFGCVVSRTWKRSARERPPHHLGRERRAAHAEHDDVVDRARRDDVVREREHVVELLQHALRLVEPAEPLRLVAAGPDGRVARPDPLDDVGRDGHAAASASRFSAIPCFSSANESMNFCTPSRSSVSVTSS